MLVAWGVCFRKLNSVDFRWEEMMGKKLLQIVGGIIAIVLFMIGFFIPWDTTLSSIIGISVNAISLGIILWLILQVGEETK